VVLAGDAAIQKLQKYRAVIAHPGIRWVEAIPLKGRARKANPSLTAGLALRAAWAARPDSD